jgi:HSP20 family molecular chaperone IbpA
VDVYESQGRFTVVVEAPGVEPDALRVVYRDRQLTITGERRHRRPAGASACLCLERPNGRFVRTVALEDALDLPQAQARLERGLLLIEIPRLKDRRGRETIIPVRREEK